MASAKSLVAYKRTPHIKRAVDADVSFEKAFSNLAHSHIRNKIPILLPYELGFQLIEKSDDNDKAVGVLGFAIGRQLLYIPVFFLSGELKGQELLYVKNSDAFVPAAENWVTYLINQRPQTLGKSVGRNLTQLGVRHPDLSILQGRSGTTKYGFVLDDWAEEILPTLLDKVSLQKLAVSMKTYEPVVPQIIKESSAAAYAFTKILDARPRLVKDVVRCYGPDLVKAALDEARNYGTVAAKRPHGRPKRVTTGSIFREKSAMELAKERDPRRTGKLKIYTYQPGVRPDGLTEKQAQTLKRKGIYILDSRDDTSKLYTIQESLDLENPTDTSIYRVLIAPDMFRRCLVVVNPHHRRGSRPSAVVVDLESSKPYRYGYNHPMTIFTGDRDDDDFARWFKQQPKAKQLEVNRSYVLVTPNGGGTAPFTVDSTCAATGGESCYRVTWLRTENVEADKAAPIDTTHYGYIDQNLGADGAIRLDRLPDGSHRFNGTKSKISLGRWAGRTIKIVNDVLYMPPGTVAVELRSKATRGVDVNGDDELEWLRFETPAMFQLGLYKSSAELKILANSTEATINGRRMPLKAAVIHLVGDHGLTEKAAAEALQRAQRNRGERFRIKYAAGYDMINSAPSAVLPDQELQYSNEPLLGPDTLAVRNSESYEPLDMAGANGPTPPPMNVGPDPELLQAVQDAAGTGQQEVLDTSILAAMLHTSKDDILIDKYLPDLLRGLDRLGRLLFNMYWHNQQFVDRFGEEDLAALEDGVRSSFDQLGKVVLKMKQRAIDPDDVDAVDVDTDEAEV